MSKMRTPKTTCHRGGSFHNETRKIRQLSIEKTSDHLRYHGRAKEASTFRRQISVRGCVSSLANETHTHIRLRSRLEHPVPVNRTPAFRFASFPFALDRLTSVWVLLLLLRLRWCLGKGFRKFVDPICTTPTPLICPIGSGWMWPTVVPIAHWVLNFASFSLVCHRPVDIAVRWHRYTWPPVCNGNGFDVV